MRKGCNVCIHASLCYYHKKVSHFYDEMGPVFQPCYDRLLDLVERNCREFKHEGQERSSETRDSGDQRP